MRIDKKMIQSICSSTIYNRGKEYFSQGIVHLRKREQNSFTAIVDGESIYNVQVSFKDDKINDYFCTCPYYMTMSSSCKHIVASLLQYEEESDSDNEHLNINDKIALDLCNSFSVKEKEKTVLPIIFTLYVTHRQDKTTEYSVGIKTGKDIPVSINDINAFMKSYISEDEYKASRSFTYSSLEYTFSQLDTIILDILAESYDDSMALGRLFPSYQTSMRLTFGSKTTQRLMGYLTKANFELILDGVSCTGMRVMEDNPDILVDISAMNENIDISASGYGVSVIPDGSWFYYEGDIYKTTEEWRSWFMPFYKLLSDNKRTHISFKGNNAISFASKVLPKIRNNHGVTTNGIDELVVDTKPVFDVYFDKYENGVGAVIKAVYGNMPIRLPDENINKEKIVVRDFEMEADILDSFRDFSYSNGVYTLVDEDKIFDFISSEILTLSSKATLYYSDTFKQMSIVNKVDISAGVKYNSNIDLLEASFETNISYEEIMGILEAIRLDTKYYRMKNGAFLNIKDNDEIAIFELLDNLEFDDDNLKSGTKKLKKHHALYLKSIADKGTISTDSGFNEFIDKVSKIKADIPKYLLDILRPYQKDGVNWIKQLSELGFGGILADDMGLGKTLQVIAFVCSEKNELPTLVVTPSALTYNWTSEIRRFAPSKTYIIIDGNQEERKAKLEDYKNYDFVITSYPLLRRDIALYEKLNFAYMFIDEAQYIKNPKTMNAKSVKKINAKNYFALTGTPIENSLTELWSIFDFAIGGYLYSHREFMERFEKTIVKDGNEKVMDELRRRISPFIMRRMKKDVLEELPEKIENTMLADLVPEQKKMYESYLAMAKDEALAIISGENTSGGSLKILSLLMRLRQICCHPMLFDKAYKKESGKLILLEELVTSAVEANHRILIFSQFTSMLSIIRKRLEKLGIGNFYLDGSTPSYERSELADRFNAGEKEVFLISLKAGGTGLNLIGADMVIHYDPWWNPAVMDQASDRAYRIGQKKAVQVIKLASCGTIEEKIIKLQDKKRNLADGIIKANKTMISKMSKDEILALFE